MTIIRTAVTQTKNAFPVMPETLDGLDALSGRLEEIRAANVAHHLDLLARAAEEGVRAIGLGELFTAPYFALARHDFWFGLAEDARTGPTITAMSAAAARHGLVVVAPIYELEAATGKRFNAAVIIDADGSVLGKYRKVHIPVGRNEQAKFDEGFYYSAADVPQNRDSSAILGDNPYFPVFRTAAGRIGVAICYDRHFEGVVSSLARAGAQIIFSPAVTFGAKSERMWEIEFEVDASRHRVFIGGSNRLGAEPPWNQPFFGRSHFVGPAGRAEDVSPDPGLVIADLDLRSLDGPDESGWDLGRDARPSAYG